MEGFGRGHADAVDVCLYRLSNRGYPGLLAMVKKPLLTDQIFPRIYHLRGSSDRAPSTLKAPFPLLDNAVLLHQRWAGRR